MAGDLDVSDLAEVRRRVVDPVLASVLAQGELTVVSLSYDVPSGWEGSWADDAAGPRRAWLVLSADEGDSTFEHPIGKAMFWRCEADYEAGFLASELDEWICLGTGFGWGGGTGIGDYTVPEPAWRDTASRVLEVYPAEHVSLPVWERGVQLTGESLGLTAELLADLIAWHQDLDDVSSAMNPESETQSIPGPAGFWLEQIDDHTYDEQKRREALLRQAGHASWREYVDLFEGRRDELVKRLRAHLGPEFQVLGPPRIP